MRSLVIVLLVVAVVNAFYEGDSKVVTLTTDNFSSLVLDSDDLWLIEFYAPWCGHCKKLTPEFDKSAKALDGIVKLGAVDMTTQGVIESI
jgi:protein disulfide-isomerase A6